MSSENRTKRARYCVVPGCKNYECDFKNNFNAIDTKNEQQIITYHNFPTKSNLRNKWFKFIGHNIKNNVSGQTWRTWTICSEHFDDSEFEENCHLECIDGKYRRINIKLKNGAVPTKSKTKLSPPPPPPTPRLYDNQKQTEINIQINVDVPPKMSILDTILSNRTIENSNIKNEYNEIDCDNETIYTEIDEDFHSKCGEVFVTRKGIFIYFCTFCNENLENSQQFINHIYEKHLSLENNNKIIKSISNNKNEKIIKLLSNETNKSQLTLEQCEIVENESGNFETLSFFDVDDNDNDDNNKIESSDNDINHFQTPKVELKNKRNISQSLNFPNFIDLTLEEEEDDDDDDVDDDDMENIKITYEDDKISIKNEAVPDLNNSNIDITSSLHIINKDNNFCPEINSEINDDNCSTKANDSFIKSIDSFINITSKNKGNNHEILPAAYSDKEYVEADDDDNNKSNDEDDDWFPVNRKHFKCRYCPKILKSQFSLKIHERSHTGERPFKCNVCSQSFKSQSILYNHERTHTGVKPFECKICGLKFSTQHNLNLHEKRHDTKENQYKCSYCNLKFLRLKKKVIHQRSHNIDIKHEPDEDVSVLSKKFKCEFCYKILSSQFSLIEHRRIHTGEKPFPCKFCPSAFRSKLLRIVHERSIHTGERPYSCIYCDKGFVTKSTRDNHERTHTKERPFKCNFCDKTYRQPSAKYIHMKTHYRAKTENGIKIKSASSCGRIDNSKIYKCEFCQKILSTQAVLNDHRRIHTGEKPFPCNECDMKFRAKSLLFYHMQTHTGEKPFECQYCHKRFRLAGNMAVHLRVHTGEKPFRCSYCDKCFRQKQNQRIHEKTHRLEKQKIEKDKDNRIWKCDICNKILLNKYTLNNHLRIHTGERPFKCSHCPSAFKSLSEHSQHERIHSGVKPYKCTMCNKAFTTKSQVNVHIRTHATKKLKPEVFECDKCDKEFRFNSNLIIHQRIHKDKSESRKNKNKNDLKL